MTIQVTREGRRSYLTGNTFPVKDVIKAAGGNWDADRKAWWLGNHAKAVEIAGTAKAELAKPVVTYTNLGETWGVRGLGLKVGATVTVTKRDGTTKEERISKIVRTEGDGIVIAEIAPQTGRSIKTTPFSSSYTRGRGTRTGCSCGSVQEYVKASDCWQCKHDNE